MAAGFIHMIEEALRQFSALSQQTLPPLSKFSYRANLQNDGDSIPLSCEMLASAEAGTGLRASLCSAASSFCWVVHPVNSA
jgi:hypothetical protein